MEGGSEQSVPLRSLTSEFPARLLMCYHGPHTIVSIQPLSLCLSPMSSRPHGSASRDGQGPTQQQADVLVIDRSSDAEADDDDDAGMVDTQQEQPARSGSSSNNSRPSRPDSSQPSSRQSARGTSATGGLSSLGQRIAAAAAYAEAEEAAAVTSSSRASTSSASQRRLPSSAGFTARLYTSHGMPSARGPAGWHELARPATAEQRHLAE